jgi:aspartate/methionine/tyrosine aminotransferase
MPQQHNNLTDIADIAGAIRVEARREPESGIISIINYGRDRDGIIPLWVGQGDTPTPQFIFEPAVESLHAGETFYTYQRGIPELRQGLADYHGRLYGRSFDAENFFVTGSGMQAMQTVVQAIAGTGDEIVLPSPAWTNYPAPLRLAGVVPREVPMTFENGRWSLDLDRLFDAVTERTRAIFVNSPSNPLGTILSAQEILAIRDFCRARGLWIVSDEVYARFYYGPGAERGALPPSFLDVCDVEERFLSINTFSKNWAMTGWRVGWMIAPRSMGQVIENLIQYNTSGTAQFMQRACVTALQEGEPFVAEQVAQARLGREIVCEALRAIPGVRFHEPEGAFYLFFSVDDAGDVNEFARRMVDDIAVGVAPGTAFGPGGEGFMRLCYARSAESLREAMQRLTGWLEKT